MGDDQDVEVVINVRFRPEDIEMHLVPSSQKFENEKEAIENGKVVCQARANPLASYNMTLPSGMRSPQRKSTPPRESYVIGFESGFDGMYGCTACNEYGCTTISKSVDELMNRKGLGKGIIVLGLPLWAIIGICLLILVLAGAALVFIFQCRDRKNSYPKKKKYGAGQLCKDVISKPFGMDGNDQQ